MELFSPADYLTKVDNSFETDKWLLTRAWSNNLKFGALVTEPSCNDYNDDPSIQWAPIKSQLRGFQNPNSFGSYTKNVFYIMPIVISLSLRLSSVDFRITTMSGSDWRSVTSDNCTSGVRDDWYHHQGCLADVTQLVHRLPTIMPS